MRRRFLPSALLMLAVSASAATAQPAHTPAEPQSYTEAMELLAAGDTAAAIERLRAATRDAPDFGPAFLRLGALLARGASEIEREFSERVEAERALERALRLMGDEPEVLLEYGLLFKRQNKNRDAERVLRRAWTAAERKGREFPPLAAAEMHYTLGRIYQTWWEDWQGLIVVPPTVRGELHCLDDRGPFSSIAEAIAACPERAEELMELVPKLEVLKTEERQRMLAHFWQALVLNPAHIEAGISLLGHLADEANWEEYVRVAHRLALVAPDEPRVHLFIGLGLHERGRSMDADTAFRRALALLPPEERRVFEDITPLLPRRVRDTYERADSAGREEMARLLYAARDPILLTSVEERRIEHWARLAWADLKFGSPTSGIRGWDTERGQIWVRYGRPVMAIQVAARVGRATGRHEIWTYGQERLAFRFMRSLGYRNARMPSLFLAQDLEGYLPELYRPRTVTELVGLPVQIVRFRGDGPGLTRLELIAGMPLDSLGPAGQHVESGVFLFDSRMHPVWERRITMRTGIGSPAVTYRIELAPGTYHTAVEARLAGPDSVPRPLARFRQEVSTTGFAAGELGVSDLLLATDVEPLASEPRTRDDLRIAPNPSVTYAPGQPIALYFELYNLLPDAEQFASYELELVVTVDEIQREGWAVGQLLAELADKWGLTAEGSDAIQLRFRKEANVLARDMIPEYFKIQIPDSPNGRYTLRLTARDRNADRTVTTERTFYFRRPAAGPQPATQ